MIATHAGALVPHVVPDACDPYGHLVVALLHFEEPNGSTTVTDSSFYENPWTMNIYSGDTSSISTVDPIMGTASYAQEDSSGGVPTHRAVLSTPASSLYAAAGDFTIEFRYNGPTIGILSSTTVNVFSSCTTSNDDTPAFNAGEWVFGSFHDSSVSRRLRFAIRAQDNSLITVNAPTEKPFNRLIPHALAITRAAGVIRIFDNGDLVAIQSGAPDTTPLSGASLLSLGGRKDGLLASPTDFTGGQYDEFRFTVGRARYTENYTPETTQFLPRCTDPV